MANLTVQRATQAGTTPTYQAASAGGDTINPGDDVALHVKNASGASITVTVQSHRNCDQGFEHDLSVAVPAGAERIIGPLPANRFANPTTGLAEISYSSATSVTVAAVAT